MTGGFYATQQECTQAGNMWVTPNANPTHSRASFACNYVGPNPSILNSIKSKTSRALAKFLQFSKRPFSQPVDQ